MFPNRTPSRKRWNLHDGPKGSLKRFRNQLAEDGCTESQVILAKQLLEEECELEADRVSNFRQAVDWLICATEQGHQEARIILKKCCRSGVLCENSSAMLRAKSCLAANRQETVARKAARELFASLSNGEEYITTVQLERKIREICNVTLPKEAVEDYSTSDPSDKEDEGALEPHSSGDHQGNGTVTISKGLHDDYEISSDPSEIQNLSVDNLVSAAEHYCQGALPLIGSDLTLTDPSRKSLDHIPHMHRAFLHPIVFLQVFYLKFLYYFSSFSFRMTSEQLVLFLVVYTLLGVEVFTTFFPIALYYLSFITMMISTCKMLHAKRQFIDFRKWSGLFLRYSEGNLQPDESENLYVRRNLAPFLYFFVALFVNLFLYPFIEPQWTPFSELTVLSSVLTFVTLFAFSANSGPFPDFLALLSFFINVLAKYPYEEDTVVHQGWRFLDLHIEIYPSYIVGDGVEFCLNARVFFSLLIPFIIFTMAKRGSWSGIYKYAIPHCVTLSWLQIFIMSSQGATMYGLVRSTLALAGVFLFLPIMGIVTLILPMFACIQSITLSNVLYAVAVTGSCLLSLLISCSMAKIERTKKYITPFQITIGLIAFLYLISPVIQRIQEDGMPQDILELIRDKKSISDRDTEYMKVDNDFGEDHPDDTIYELTWDDYYNYCNHVGPHKNKKCFFCYGHYDEIISSLFDLGSVSWASSNVALTQSKCSVLAGSKVHWQGYVIDVQIETVQNMWRDLQQSLPDLMQDWFACQYGERHNMSCASPGSLECRFLQAALKRTGTKCHFNHYDSYTYIVKVEMESGGLLKNTAEVTLSVDNHFSNFTRLLQSQDKLTFKGTLQNYDFSIGSRDPVVSVHQMKCSACQSRHIDGLTVSSKIQNEVSWCRTFVSDVAVSVKYVLNFILNPIIVFK